MPVRYLIPIALLSLLACAGSVQGQTVGRPGVGYAAIGGDGAADDMVELPKDRFQHVWHAPLQPVGASETTADDVFTEMTADPASPVWGLDRSMPASPAGGPSQEYLVVGPATGIVQQEGTQVYHQQLANPEDAFYTARFNTASIDLYRPDGLAPAGVFGDHTLNGPGQVLLSYRYNYTDYSQLYNGSHQIGPSDVLAHFPISPTRLIQQQHIALLEYAPTQDLTIMAKLPFWQQTMDYASTTGPVPTSSVTNPGDIQVSGMYVLKRWDRQQIHLNFGLSVPVGILQQQGEVITPTSPNFSYPMRISSGTFDLLPGLTYRGQTDDWTWGAQVLGTVRTGRNHFGYTLGDQVGMTGWLSRRWTDTMSTSARLDGQVWGNIQGFDPRLNQALVPTNVPGMQGGSRLNLLFGTNYCLPAVVLPGQRLSIEAGFPLYQNLSGDQLGVRWLMTASWNLIY
ncbi:MAG TPA: hypothetical protein VHB77_22195 [Planctomycetaceae bacterium]|nr:hypothetical protein [Planctomycetaceae bacterium]